MRHGDCVRAPADPRTAPAERGRRDCGGLAAGQRGHRCGRHAVRRTPVHRQAARVLAADARAGADQHRRPALRPAVSVRLRPHNRRRTEVGGLGAKSRWRVALCDPPRATAAAYPATKSPGAYDASAPAEPLQLALPLKLVTGLLAACWLLSSHSCRWAADSQTRPTIRTAMT